MGMRTLGISALLCIALTTLFYYFVTVPAEYNLFFAEVSISRPPWVIPVQVGLGALASLLSLTFVIKLLIPKKKVIPETEVIVEEELGSTMTNAERRTKYFEGWSNLYRGSLFWDIPVLPEPPFFPFDTERFFFREEYKKTIPIPPSPHFIKRYWPNSSPPQPVVKNEAWEKTGDLPQVIPMPEFGEEEYIEMQILLPENEKPDLNTLEQCLLIAEGELPISFEIIGDRDEIVHQFVAYGIEQDICRLADQLEAHIPNAKTHFYKNALVQKLDKHVHVLNRKYSISEAVGVYEEEFMRPLATYTGGAPDPLTGLIGTLETISSNGVFGIFRVSFQKARHNWTPNILQSVTDSKGESFFSNAPEMPKLAEMKMAAPLYAVTVSVFAIGSNTQEALSLANEMANSVRHSTSSDFNKLKFVHDEYNRERGFLALETDMLRRRAHRSGMLMNSKELLTLVHLPHPSIKSKKLRPVSDRTTKEAPDNVLQGDYVLGVNHHQGKERVVALNTQQRLRHIHIIGASGTGKSQLLLSLILQDVEADRGLILLDPHGDLVDKTLTNIPPHRYNDVVIIDPSDSEFPVGINLLSAKTELEKTILSSDLVATFRRLSTSWGDQMNSILANAIHAFLESSRGGTLTELRRFLSDQTFRADYLKTVSDPSSLYFWNTEFPQLRANAVAPILTRLDVFLRPKLIRNMMAQKEGVDFDMCTKTSKIVLVKLSRGLIGQENSSLLGTLLVAKINQVAQTRQLLPEHERTPFFLYIDEFQNFITPSMEEILSGGRKYGLGTILAHQGLRQLFQEDRGVGEGIIANANVRICFRLGDNDADTLGKGFANFNAVDLQNLKVGQAIIRAGKSTNDCNINTTMRPPVDPVIAEKRVIDIQRRSRNKYAQKKEEVEGIWRASLSQSKSKKEAPAKMKEKPTNPQKAGSLTHRKIQKYIQSIGEKHGFKAVIEEATHSGQVDVGLTRGSLKIACEVSTTNLAKYEVATIKNRLGDGYDLVIVTSDNFKHLTKIKNLADKELSTSTRGMVYFTEFLDLDEYLELIPKEFYGPEKVRGYTVSSEFPPAPDCSEDSILPPTLFEDD